MKENYEKKIKKLISEMTTEEKAGQLRQCGPSLVGAFGVSVEELLDMMSDGRISEEEFNRLMRTAEQDYREDDLRAGRIGSYMGVNDAKTANRLQKIAVEETRLGIPLLFGYDVIHGFRTVTPVPLAESCSWEPELWERTARMAAEEAAAAGIHMTFAPMVDVAKDARWGRITESAGEDVLLNGRYGAAKVKGFQGDDLKKADAMVACVKHFAAYGAGEAGRDYNRVDMSMQRLWNEYMMSYKACIDAGARAVMPAFNDINGIPCTVNPWLLRKVLREKWGFDGMTISDADAIAECVDHGVAADKKEAAKKALLAGIDMDMASDSYIEHVGELVQSGAVDEQLLDQAVENILRIKFELGLFEHPYRTDEKREQHTILKPEFRKLALEAAQKSMVLLKNEGFSEDGACVLPFKEGMRLGIFGSLAAERGEMTGAWAIAADGEDCISLVDACEKRGISFRFDKGIRVGRIDTEAVQRIAKTADVLIAALGEPKAESGEAASKADISLPREQIALLECMIRTKRPVVVVLFNGRPLAIPEIAEQACAVLEAWHPGVEAGNAVADILFGHVAPSGKLTTTFPYTTGQCPLYYAHMNTGRPGGRSKFTSKYLDTPLEPVYPFGYGLSYTEYEYSGLEAWKQPEGIRVSVQVKNIGTRDGEEIVQCYIQAPCSESVRPVRELAAFRKVSIQAQETASVMFEIPMAALGYYNWAMEYVIESGKFKIFVGKNSRDTLETTVE